MAEYLTIENSFLVLALFSTIFYIIKLCLFFFLGGDVEVHAEFDTMGECDPSFNFLSLQSILAFLMGFGWVGLAALTQFNTSILVAVIFAVVVGLFFMFMSAWLMLMIKKLDKNIKIDMNDYIGTVGRTYTAFKPHGEGQIEVTINKQLSVLKAYNDTDEEIHSFTEIKISRFENNMIYIVRA